jgi:hypothetical protein
LFLGGLLGPLAIATFQPFPGYLDSDYYFAGGMSLAAGAGFTEHFLWNYLDGPAGLPHPSHGYWMPLASILSAASMAFTGQQGYVGARAIFIVLAALVPPLTAALAHGFSRRNDLALTAGLLAILSGFYAAFLPVTDNFGVFMVLGGAIMLLLERRIAWCWIGVLAGFMGLARTDGMLWLALALAAVPVASRSAGSKAAWRRAASCLPALSCCLVCQEHFGLWLAFSTRRQPCPLALHL